MASGIHHSNPSGQGGWAKLIWEMNEWLAFPLERVNRSTIDDQTTDVTGFTMRKAAVILPDLGTSPDTPVVVSYWFAARGQMVWEGDRLVEVLVGPATFDVPAPATGRLVEIRMREDDPLPPGAFLGSIAVLDEDSDDETQDAPDPGSDDHDRNPREPPRRSGHRPT